LRGKGTSPLFRGWGQGQSPKLPVRCPGDCGGTLELRPFQWGAWTFQQDSAPAHKAKIVQKWLQDHVPDFIATQDWPSASPDLSPLDYEVWSTLEAKVCSKPYESVEALKRSLTRGWDRIPMETLRKSVEEWRNRFRRCIEAMGGNFET
jgi:inhibitor of nuclear factor kappa-B kinase subunit alpha